MNDSLASNLVYLAATAYLAVWLVIGGYRFSKRSRLSRLERTNAVNKNRKALAFISAGCILGTLAAVGLENSTGNEGVVLLALALALWVEGLLSSASEVRSLAVLVCLEGLRHAEGSEFFEKLAPVIETLPVGEVQSRLRELVQGWRSGQSSEIYLRGIRGVDPYLDELFIALSIFDFRMGSGMQIVLDRLIPRAANRWDLASRKLRMKLRLTPFLLLVKAGLLTFLGTALFLWKKPIPQGWISFGVVGWFGLAMAGLVLLAWFVPSIPSLKVSVMVICLVMGMGLIFPAIRPPDLTRLGFTISLPAPTLATSPFQPQQETVGTP